MFAVLIRGESFRLQVNEHPEALPAVDRATALCGESPENFLADGGMATGPIMAGLEQREITGFVPAKSNEPAADSPVHRDDLTQPLPEEQWSKLPLSPRGQLDKSNFVYVAERDEYVCPLVARCLSHAKNTPQAERTEARGRVRSLRRDEHEEVRQRTAARMARLASSSNCGVCSPTPRGSEDSNNHMKSRRTLHPPTHEGSGYRLPHATN